MATHQRSTSGAPESRAWASRVSTRMNRARSATSSRRLSNHLRPSRAGSAVSDKRCGISASPMDSKSRSNAARLAWKSACAICFSFSGFSGGWTGKSGSESGGSGNGQSSQPRIMTDSSASWVCSNKRCESWFCSRQSLIGDQHHQMSSSMLRF